MVECLCTDFRVWCHREISAKLGATRKSEEDMVSLSKAFAREVAPKSSFRIEAKGTWMEMERFGASKVPIDTYLLTGRRHMVLCG
jgi:hypothetical protein